MDPAKPNYTPFKARLIITLIMLVLGFIGVIITDVKKDGGWVYWRFLAIVYAILSICLSAHLKQRGWKITTLTVWHEIGHWAGVIGAIFICSYLVSTGLIGRFEASIVMLLLLALSTYLVGIYTEPTFIVIGIALGAFATCIAFLDAYLYNIFLPLTIVLAVGLVFLIRHAHKKITSASD